MRRVKEGTSAVLLQSGLNESWWADSVEFYTYLRMMGRRPTKDVLDNQLKDRLFHLNHCLRITLQLRRISQESISFEKFYLNCSSYTHCTWREFGRVTCWSQTLKSWRRWTHRKSIEKTQCERSDISQTRRIYFFQSQMDELKPREEIRN